MASVIIFVGFIAAVILLGNTQKVTASADGPTASFTNAPGEANCTACHTTYPLDSGTGQVQISGVPQTYVPGQQVQITVKTSQDDGVIFGFQITAIDSTGLGAGTFTIPAPVAYQMKTKRNAVAGNLREYVEHQRAGTFTDGVFGSNTWTFTWTAPSPARGKIDFYAAGNAANGDGTNSGDYIYTTSASISSLPLVTISGRVTTPDGAGLKNARVNLVDSSGNIRSVITNSFGLYSFNGVQSGTTYSLTALSKRFSFSSKDNLAVDTQLSNVDFTGFE